MKIKSKSADEVMQTDRELCYISLMVYTSREWDVGTSRAADEVVEGCD